VANASGGSNTKQHSICKTTNIKVEARASMYRGTLIYIKPSIARCYTNLVWGYDSSMRHMRTASAY